MTVRNSTGSSEMISVKGTSGRDQAGRAVGPGCDLMMSLPSSGGALQPN